jgi:hypothetical protein
MSHLIVPLTCCLEVARMVTKSTGSDTDEQADRPAAPAGRGAAGGSNLERVTVNLTPRSVAALDSLVQLTGDTKTDAINKALQVYSYLQNVLQNGGALYVRESDSTELERLRFF